MNALIDVVISTKNNIAAKNASLIFTIRALLHQKNVDLNIIVADNGSDDDTSAILNANFGGKVGVIDTSEDMGNLSRSRNRAASCGQAETIFFVDDDMIPASASTVEECLRINADVDFCCGARRLWAPADWPKLIRSDDPINKLLSTLKNISFEPHSINRISGRNILDNRSYIANFGFIKRSVFEAAGRFDEGYVGFGYQDTDLMYRLCLDGKNYDILASHGINCYHLSHIVDKGKMYEENRSRFLEKQKLEGRLFKTNHFFEIYENDGYSLFTEFSTPNR